MSLNNFSICESRDVEFFEHVFSLKKNVCIGVYETIFVHENVNMHAFSSVVRDPIDELRKSQRRKVETSFGPDFRITFLIEDFGVNFLTNELVSAFFLSSRSKNFRKGRGIDRC